MSTALEAMSPLAKHLYATYRQMAVTLNYGAHVPETWEAVAEAAEIAILAALREGVQEIANAHREKRSV